MKVKKNLGSLEYFPFLETQFWAEHITSIFLSFRTPTKSGEKSYRTAF